jgi:hypothetical protein
MADLRHTTKKQLDSELKVAKLELAQTHAARERLAKEAEEAERGRLEWKQAAEQMRVDRDRLNEQVKPLQDELDAQANAYSKQKQWAELVEKTNKGLNAQLSDMREENKRILEKLTDLSEDLTQMREHAETVVRQRDRESHMRNRAERERDRARAALQALALSNGRLTDHMEARELVVSTTDAFN